MFDRASEGEDDAVSGEEEGEEDAEEEEADEADIPMDALSDDYVLDEDVVPKQKVEIDNKVRASNSFWVGRTDFTLVRLPWNAYEAPSRLTLHYPGRRLWL